MVVSLFCIGAVPGALFIGPMAETYGRKPLMLGNNAIFVAGGVVEAASKWVCKVNLSAGLVCLIAGRILSGAASGVVTAVVPMYLGEISPPALRGALGTAFQLVVVIAMFIVQVIGLPSIFGTEDGWAWLFLAVVVPCVLQFLMAAFLVESPRWLLRQDDPHSEALAEKNLKILRGREDVTLELQQIVQESQPQMCSFASSSTDKDRSAMDGEPMTCSQVVCGKQHRLALTIALVGMGCQQLSGINNAFNYSTTFLENNGLASNTTMIISIAMNGGNLVITVVATYLMDKAGRRVLLLGSATAMALALVILTIGLKSGITPLCIVGVVIFVSAFGVGMGPIPWLLAPEILPTEALSKGNALAAIVNWTANFFVALTFGPLSNILGSFSFAPNACVLFCFIVFVAVKLPETKGKTLEQIQEELNGMDGAASAPSTNKNVDGYDLLNP